MLYHVICNPIGVHTSCSTQRICRKIKREFATIDIYTPPPYITNKVYNTCPTFGDDNTRLIFTLYDECPNDFHNVGVLREKIKKFVPSNYKIDIVARK